MSKKEITIHEKLDLYRIMKIQLAELKAREMILRVEIAEELSGDEGLAAGTHNFRDFLHLKVKLVKKLNYSLDKVILETLDLTEEEAECIRWKPELALKAYKEADDTSNIDEALTVKDGAPELVVELSE